MGDLREINHHSPQPFHTWMWPAIVISLGVFFRYYSLYFTPVVNQDAIYYINQAKAIYYGHYSDVRLCYPYVSLYPLMVALCYHFLGNWITSGAMVSLLFSSFTLIPLYLLLRRFFDRDISTLALLIFAVCPKFVAHSHMIIKGPVYWFFAAWGIYLFVLARDEMKAKYLVLSCVSFILASSSRGEALFYLGGSALFLIIAKGDRKWRQLFFFLLPVLSILLLFSPFLFFTSGASAFSSASFRHVFSKTTSVIDGYTNLLHALRNLDKLAPPPGFSPYFFPAVRRMIFLLAFGELFRAIMNAFFAPFFILLLAGIPGIKNGIKNDNRLGYLSLLSAGSLLVLYAQTMSNWAIITRHVFLFLLPSFVFVGFGFLKLTRFLEKRLRCKTAVIYPTLFLAIFLAALPNNMKVGRGEDKLAFKQIGTFIAMQQRNDQKICVDGAFKWISLVDLYANLDFPGVNCCTITSRSRDRHRTTIQQLLKSNVDYYVWDEKYGTQEMLQAIIKECPRKCKKLGQWTSGKVGKMILFKIRE